MSNRRYGLPSCTALVVASMIGAGVFTTSGYSLATLGTPPRVLAAWGVGGVLAVLGALCYGALAARLRESGGEYLFLSRTLHPALGFLSGWISLWAGFTAPIAVAAAAFGAYGSGLCGLEAENAGRWADPIFTVDALRVIEATSKPWLAAAGLAFTIPISGRLGATTDLQDAKATVAHVPVEVAIAARDQLELGVARLVGAHREVATFL